MSELAGGSGAPAVGLRRGAIGLREVLFQSITDMAPGAAIAASIPAGVYFAGGSLPLSVLLALVACLLCASCVGELARELPSAGGLGTYTARGLHPSLGFLVNWAYVAAAGLIPALVLLAQRGRARSGTGPPVPGDAREPKDAPEPGQPEVAGLGSFGSPRTRSPTMFRWISAVPPQMVSDLEKKNWACRSLTG